MPLSILSWNIMHGRNRRSALWPPKVSREEAMRNLDSIAAYIATHSPDIVALQEVDRYSLLSGGFDQFDYLQQRLAYPYGGAGASCSIAGVFVSGNAILSKLPLQNFAAHKFAPTFPTDRMGFVSAEALLPGGKSITVASVHLVHLDWLRRDTRARELRELEWAIDMRRAILAGDFNCDVCGAEDALSNFAAQHRLLVKSAQMTHPAWAPARRIDWILPAHSMSIDAYRVLPEQLSDHCAVFATIRV